MGCPGERPRGPRCVLSSTPGSPVRSRAFLFSLFCLGGATVLAQGPAEPWYVAEEPGHFDYYWSDRSGSSAHQGRAAGIDESATWGDGYQSESPYGPQAQGRPSPWADRMPAQSHWNDTTDVGARWADLGPGDYRILGDRWSGGTYDGGHGSIPTDVDPHAGMPGMPGDSSSYPVGIPATYPGRGRSSGPAFRFRPPENAAAGRFDARAPRFGAGQYAESPMSAYPRYRFRGDPLPGESGWRMDSGVATYRFRPLSEQELERIQSSSGYRPLGGTQGASFYRPRGQDEGWRPGAGGWQPDVWADR